jgi:hypothetical protein
VKELTGFCCNMQAMTQAERQRYNMIRARLEAAVTDAKELPDGYAFQLQTEQVSLAEIKEWIGYEQKCCPFFDLVIEAAQDDKPATLKITGNAGVKDFIRAEFTAVNFR